MRKFWLATVLSVTVGGVLMPGIANAATTPDPGSTTMSPVMVVGGTSDPTGSTGTSSDSSSSTPSKDAQKQADKAAKDAAKQAEQTAKDAAKQADKAAKDAAKQADKPAGKDGSDNKGHKHDGANQGAPVPKDMPGSASNPWLNNPGLFGGGGRSWG